MPGRAVAALHRADREEGFLKCVQLVADREAFDGADLLARRGFDAGAARADRGWPSIRTVQAPQRPSPQPYFAPVRPRSSRSTLSSVRSGVGVDRPRRAVDVKFLDSRHEVIPPM